MVQNQEIMYYYLPIQSKTVVFSIFFLLKNVLSWIRPAFLVPYRHVILYHPRVFAWGSYPELVAMPCTNMCQECSVYQPSGRLTPQSREAPLKDKSFN